MSLTTLACSNASATPKFPRFNRFSGSALANLASTSNILSALFRDCRRAVSSAANVVVSCVCRSVTSKVLINGVEVIVIAGVVGVGLGEVLVAR